jgi:lipid A 3-O-deacylase
VLRRLNIFWVFTVIVTQHETTHAQLTDNHSPFSLINSDWYLRIHYDNDFFTNTDHYYTQGITIEYVNTFFRQSPLAALLIRAKDSAYQTGLRFDLSGYTPTSINSDEILPGDRPFAGLMQLEQFALSRKPEEKIWIASSISAGIIGPAALGEEIQTNIHRWTGNKIPQGWQHQVRNDVILQYKLSISKKLVSTKPFLLAGMTTARLGTMQNRIGTGLNFMAGLFDDPFLHTPKKKTNLFLFGQAQGNLVGYDATMQGGLFNRSSPYTIKAGDITRLTFQAEAGLVLQLKKLWFRYSQAFTTKEFRSGKTHRWGGVAAGISL